MLHEPLENVLEVYSISNIFITFAPFKANRITGYTGPMFGRELNEVIPSVGDDLI